VLPVGQAKRVAGALRAAAERVQAASEGDQVGVG